MKIKDIMVTEVASCSAQTSLQDIATLMWNNDCGAIPLVDAEERPIGIVTDRDIAMGAALQHRPLWELSGDNVTHGREIFCCRPDDDISDALTLMESQEIRRLPVINQFDQLCGMVSMGDIVSFTRSGRARKGEVIAISAGDTLGFLKHVSGHHDGYKAIVTR